MACNFKIAHSKFILGIILFCVDTVMKWYDMSWKWVVNDEMMEADGMNLGVFVSSYVYIYI